MKLTKRLGPGLLEELNAGLLTLAVERKVLRSRRLRVDTTVVEADIRSPTDSGLCAHALARSADKARVADTGEGFVIADIPERGGPVDAGLLDGAITKAKKAGMQVRSVYADRGFGTSTGNAALTRHHIRDPVIPRQQRAAPIEHCRNWKRRYRYRNGLEGRISQLRRKGLRRTRLRTLSGAQTWVGGIALAHNLQRMALLT